MAAGHRSSGDIDPVARWESAMENLYPTSPAPRKKGGPRGAFPGLCEAGLVKGIPAGRYTASKDNKAYAVRAAELLAEGTHNRRRSFFMDICVAIAAGFALHPLKLCGTKSLQRPRLFTISALTSDGYYQIAVFGSTRFERGVIGKDDRTMDPMVPPGSIVYIDTNDRVIPSHKNWADEFHRPIFSF
jgi:hypothetical protein